MTLQYRAKKGHEFISIYIGVVKKDDKPDIAKLTKSLNDIGWINSDQVIGHLGAKAWTKLCKSILLAERKRLRRNQKGVRAARCESKDNLNPSFAPVMKGPV